jgi:uncharacterized protein
MAVYFLDSSALVKRYLKENGSKWVLALFDPALDNEIFVAAIAGVGMQQQYVDNSGMICR